MAQTFLKVVQNFPVSMWGSVACFAFPIPLLVCCAGAYLGFIRLGSYKLRLQNQCRMLAKCRYFKTGTLLKTVTPKILAMTQSRNYNELPVWSVCLYFCHYNFIHNHFLFSVLCFYKMEGSQTTHSTPPPSSSINLSLCCVTSFSPRVFVHGFRHGFRQAF